MKNKIYSFLVNRVPAIQKRYHAIRQQRRGTVGRLYAWLALMGMNVAWLFGKRKFGEDYLNPDANKKLPKDLCESAVSKREEPEEFAKRLLEYDVISFDVFDTLIYRPVSAPTDLFFFVGEKLNYLDFERIRREMEWRARQRAHEKSGSYEVTLSDIYNEMEEQAGIPKELGMRTEIETEISMCFGNPYMLKVFEYLQNQGKTIICTSDMYLPREVIETMVAKSGFKGICKFFVSCEERASKGDGSLFVKVKESFGNDKRYVHVGDHPVSDGERARKAGFDSEFYQNANIAGMPYRAEDMSIMMGSLYRGIVNSRIHNGLKQYTKEYELGYIYAGIFVLGYCQWIHQYVKEHEVDKILFLARDGDILYKAYKVLYPQESELSKAQYVYWSRLAATKMGAEYFKYDYLRRFIDHKVNQGYTLKKIFASMEVVDMLPTMCANWSNFVESLIESDKVVEKSQSTINNMRKQKSINEETQLTDLNAWMIREYLIIHWKEVLTHYEEQNCAGKEYYEKALIGCKKVAAVDIGWAGSGAVVLDYLVQKKWNLGCKVIGLVAGTNSIYNAEPNMSEAFLFSGDMASFLYSQEKNRDIWKIHDPGKGYNLVWEMLLESPHPTFKGFCYKDGVVDFVWGKKDDNQEGIEQLQQGIMDFVNDYQKLGIKKDITGADVYHAMVILNNNNRKMTEDIRKSFDQVMNVE